MIGGWIDLFVAALGGGLTVKLLDILYQEYRQWKSHSRSAADVVEKHLDPLLKAADELVGKARALGERDFKPLQNLDTPEPDLTNHNFSSLVYLVAQFWVQIELMRQEGMSVAMGRSSQGARLQKFFDCMESRRVRLIDRILQRAVGEVLLKDGRPMSFVEFVNAVETDADVKRWLDPLMHLLSRVRHTTERQRLLQYVAVVHALIDTLDPGHLVTRERPSLPNKLTKKSRADLNYRVFGVYLAFVKDRQKYIGPPKRRPYRNG